MKNILLYFIIQFTSLVIYSQNFKEVYIVDNNGIAIPFANIYLSETTGYISNKDGGFIFNENIDKNTIISISHIAYETKKIRSGEIINIDSIYLKPHNYLLDEIVLNNSKIPDILNLAFKNINYKYKRKYISTRLFATEDSIYYYTEKTFRAKVDNKKVKTKSFGNLYYKAPIEGDIYINYPLATIIGKNPYTFYNKKHNLKGLIENSYLEAEYEKSFMIKSITDSTNITLYINKSNNRLYRFEKIIKSKTDSTTIETINYVYEFEFEKRNTVVLRSFKYHSFSRTDSIIVKNLYMQDIIVDEFINKDSISFDSLKELSKYKLKQKNIDINLYQYFNKNIDNKKIKVFKPTSINEENNTLHKNSTHMLNYLPIYSKFNIDKSVTFTQVKSAKYSYLALYNSNQLGYNNFNSEYDINFDVNSVKANQHFFNSNHIDSFNPYGTKNPEISVSFGVINYFLEKFQD